MLKNYLTVAIRNLWRNKTYATVSIGGLALGLAAVFIIALFVLHETKYDAYHENADRIYRVYQSTEGRETGQATTPPVLGRWLRSQFPDDVDVVARIVGIGTTYFQWRGELTPMDGMYAAEPEIFDLFTMPLANGDATTALNDPHSIVLSQRMAERYFGDTDPVGEVLPVRWRDEFVDFQVTGVLEPIPETTQIRPDFIIPAALYLPSPSHGNYEDWGYNNVRSYIRLAPNVDPLAFEKKLNAAIQPEFPDRDWFTNLLFYLQPLSRVHLYSAQIAASLGRSGNVMYVAIFSGVAILILLIAWFNYINLNAATAMTRLKEIGIRKVVGAERQGLILQSMVEALLVSLLALPIALFLVELVMPFVGRLLVGTLLEEPLALHVYDNWSFILVMLGVVSVVGISAGAYTALTFFNLMPVSSLKGSVRLHSTRSWFRRLSITFQFIVFIALATSTLLFYRQMHYTQTTNMGYNQEQVVAIQMPGQSYQTGPETVNEGMDVFRNRMLQLSGVEDITFATTIPPNFGNWMIGTAKPENEALPDFNIRWVSADSHFRETLGLEMTDGEFFSGAQFNQESQDIVINQTAADMLGLEQPVGETVIIGNLVNDLQWRVIGVLEDFHMRSLYEEEMPLFIVNWGKRMGVGYMAVRLAPNRIPETLDQMRDVWKEIAPYNPIQYTFLDEAFDQIYRADRALGQLFGGFASFAIFLACMGLFGLVTFAAQRRTKEIGIRKVVGASVAQIVRLLSKEFLILVIVANVIAWPVAYYAMNKWLQNFAYHINLSWWIFVLSGLMALVIALLTVSYQAIRAATANPVEALRYE